MIIFIFVDDIAVIYDQRHVQKVDEFQIEFFHVYEMRYLGEVQWFLGIRITRDRNSRRISLCQDSYINKLISKFNVNITSKAPDAPLSAMKKSKRMLIRQRLFYDVAMNINHAVSIVFEIEDFIKYEIYILLSNFETF